MPKKEVVTYTRKLDIPEEKIAEYKEAFDMFDKNKKGTISANDITKIMKISGIQLVKKKWKEWSLKWTLQEMVN